MLPVPRILLPLGLGALVGAGMGLIFPFKVEPSTPPALTSPLPSGRTQKKPHGPLPVSKTPRSPQEATAASLAAESLTEAAELMARIAVAEVTDLPGLVEALEKLPYLSVERDLAEAAYFQRWVELRPEAGLAWLQQTGRQDSIPGLAARWLQSDPTAAFIWFQNHPGELEKAEIWAAGSASDDELKQILSVSADLPDRRVHPQLNRSITTMAQRDPAWAMAFYDRLEPGSKETTTIASAIATGLAYRDMRGALAWAKGLPEESMRDSAIKDALRIGSYADPGTVRALLGEVNLPDSSLVDIRLKVAMHLATHSLPEALDFLGTLPEGSLKENVNAFELVFRPGMDLKELHALLSNCESKGIDREGIFVNWSGRDGMADAAQLATLPEGPLRDQMMDQLTKAIARTPDYRNLEAFAALPVAAREGMARGLWNMALYQGDQATARQYWDYLPDKDRSPALLSMARVSYTPENLPLLEGWLQTLPPKEQTLLRGSLVQSMAERDPVAATAYVATLPEQDQAIGVGHISKFLVEDDERAAAQWVESMTPGPLRDAATAPLVVELAKVDPDSAMVWARSIGGESVRAETLESLGFMLMSQDTGAAVTMMDNSGLGEADRKAFLKGIETARKYQ